MDPVFGLPENLHVRVMIADDVQETRESISLMLSVMPEVEVVASAENGLEAVELARLNMPDLALVDVNMPEMDGLTAIRTMLADQPDLICVVISAERDSQTIRQAISSGARGYLIKPFTYEELEDMVNQAVSHVSKQQRAFAESVEVQRQRDGYLNQLAREYAASHRTDDQALEVYEQLAADPSCETRWLVTLAMVYVVRRDWAKLKRLAERMEKQINIATAT